MEILFWTIIRISTMIRVKHLKEPKIRQTRNRLERVRQKNCSDYWHCKILQGQRDILWHRLLEISNGFITTLNSVRRILADMDKREAERKRIRAEQEATRVQIYASSLVSVQKLDQSQKSRIIPTSLPVCAKLEVQKKHGIRTRSKKPGLCKQSSVLGPPPHSSPLLRSPENSSIINCDGEWMWRNSRPKFFPPGRMMQPMWRSLYMCRLKRARFKEPGRFLQVEAFTGF